MSIQISELKRAKEILNAEITALHNIPLSSTIIKAVDILYSCHGKIITCGMGKAGAIAAKMAGTLCSTASPALYLHPGEAAHGDLGILSKGDVIIAYSTSGKTRGIIEMLELAHHFGVDDSIGITSHPDSPLRQLCSLVIDMGEINEPCTLGLTPTASSLVMLAISDILSLLLMERKKITPIDFGLRHHGGYLGDKVKERKQM